MLQQVTGAGITAARAAGDHHLVASRLDRRKLIVVPRRPDIFLSAAYATRAACCHIAFTKGRFIGPARGGASTKTVGVR